jgi:hypothetical protein
MGRGVLLSSLLRGRPCWVVKRAGAFRLCPPLTALRALPVAFRGSPPQQATARASARGAPSRAWSWRTGARGGASTCGCRLGRTSRSTASGTWMTWEVGRKRAVVCWFQGEVHRREGEGEGDQLVLMLHGKAAHPPLTLTGSLRL